MTDTKKNKVLTVYQADTPYARAQLDATDLRNMIVEALVHQFTGDMLLLDLRIECANLPAFVSYEVRPSQFRKLLGQLNVYAIDRVSVRLSHASFDRWLALPVDSAYAVLLPKSSGLTYALRRGTGEQTPAIFNRRFSVSPGTNIHSPTHIYIPSNPDNAVPTYPHELFVEEELDLKTWSQMLLPDSKAQVQSDSGKADLESSKADTPVECKATCPVCGK